MAGELEVGQRQIDADGDPDLGHDGIAGGAQEALDLQVLLDPLEEQFDLPTGFVDLGDGAGGELEIVGQEIVLDAGFSILEADAAKRDGAVGGLGAGQLNGLIAG